MAEIGYGYDRLQTLNVMRHCFKISTDTRLRNFKATMGYFHQLQRRYPQQSIQVQAFDRLRAKDAEASKMKMFSMFWNRHKGS